MKNKQYKHGRSIGEVVKVHILMDTHQQKLNVKIICSHTAAPAELCVTATLLNAIHELKAQTVNLGILFW